MTIDHSQIELLRASADKAAQLLRLVGNEHRLMVLCLLADGEMHVGALRDQLGLSQSALSQHLAKMREDGLLATRRDGQTIYYRIEDPAALRLVSLLADIFCPPELKKDLP